MSLLESSFQHYSMIPEAQQPLEIPGALIWEYHQESVTISTNEGTAEIPTELGEVIGLVPLNYIAAASDPTDTYTILTDGVITSSAVTVNVKSIDIADGATTFRFFLIGKKARTVALNSPV